MIRAVLLCADRKKLLLAYFTIFGFWLAPLFLYFYYFIILPCGKKKIDCLLFNLESSEDNRWVFDMRPEKRGEERDSQRRGK